MGIIIHASRIYTPMRSDYNAVIIDKNKILGIGMFDRLQKDYPDSKVHSYSDCILVPGFNDNHIHLSTSGEMESVPQLSGLSIEEVRDILKRYYPKPKRGQIISGFGWDYDSVPSPHLSMLDELFPQNPVLLFQYGGHGVWVNSAALKKMRLTKHSIPPKNGEMVKDSDGELTGILREMNSLPLLRNYWFSIISNRKKLKRNFKRICTMLHEKGITSVQDNTWTVKGLWYLMKARLNLDITAWSYGENPWGWRLFSMLPTPSATLRKGPVKFFLDGTFTTRTALLFDVYNDDPGNAGMGLAPREIVKLIRPVIRRKRQCAFHAIGDKAISNLLDALEILEKEFPYLASLRIRIEHAQLIHKKDYPRLKRLNIQVCSQPIALHNKSKDALLLGEERMKHAYPYKDLIDHGIHLSFGSDYPGEFSFDPLKGIAEAVNRSGSQRISFEEALSCYTQGSAYAEFQEGKKGAIVPGMLADICLLNAHELEIRETIPAELTVKALYFRGERIYLVKD
jgi:predicted amidohydrolase YtcJ